MADTSELLRKKIAEWKAYIRHPERIHTTKWLGDQLNRADAFIDRLLSESAARTSQAEAQAPAVTLHAYENTLVNGARKRLGSSDDSLLVAGLVAIIDRLSPPSTPGNV